MASVRIKSRPGEDVSFSFKENTPGGESHELEAIEVTTLASEEWREFVSGGRVEPKTEDQRNARINSMIALPKKLTAEDGRTFGVIEWEPRVAVDEVITADIRVQVQWGGKAQVP